MLTFDPQAGGEQIEELQGLAKSIGQRLMALSVGPCVMTLKVLNGLSVEEVHTPWADGVALDFSEVWRGIEKRLRDPSPPRLAAGTERDRIIADLQLSYGPSGTSRRKPAG